MHATLAVCLENQQAALKAAVIDLVRIPSVIDEDAGGYPFGPAIDQALRHALQVASGLGFRTHYDNDGYYGYAEIGEGADLVGILGHVDVVPPGNLEDWHTAPFEPIEQDGMLYGRGTQDDKGPLLAALFAAKALVDSGALLNKRVRFIFGTDEETLWRCIKHYREREELPGMGFSPDARFPLVFAEKGLLQLYLEGSNRSGMHLAGGSAFNAVPDSILYDGSRQDDLAARLDQLGYTYDRKENGIMVHGKAAHAMVAEEGVNAIARLCIALEGMGVESRAVHFVAGEVGEDPYATRIFGFCADEPSGRLKFNVGKIDIGSNEQLSIDCRIPVTIAKQDIVAKVNAAAARYGLNYREADWLPPLYLPKDHFVIETLMSVYTRLTGDHAAQPVASGGATYARSMANCVAYGPLFPNELVTEHEPNERVVLANLYRAMEIYAHAIRELACRL